MSNVPKYVHLRPRRVAQEETSSAGDASEDGDFKQLREVRLVVQRKKEKRRRRRERRLPPVDEGSEPEPRREISRPVMAAIPKQLEKKSFHAPIEDNATYSALRNELFEVTDTDDTVKVNTVLDNVAAKIPISDIHLANPKTRQNVLNYALENKNMKAASAIVEKADEALLQNEFAVGKSTKTALHQVTELNETELAKRILSNLTDFKSALTKETIIEISGQRPRGLPCLHLAAFNGNTELVKVYLQFAKANGLSVDQKNQKSDTPLLWAARWGHLDTVKFLLGENADPNESNDKGSTAFYWAIRYSHVDVVRALLENKRTKVNIHKERKLGLVAPIVLASALGNNELVELLLKNGANKDHVIPGGEIPIHHAAKEGHVKVVRTLVDFKADTEKSDEKGNHALLLATKNGHTSVMRALLLEGADPYRKNHVGHNCWYYAISHDDIRVLEALIELSRDDEIEELDGKYIARRSPLFEAAQIGHCDRIEYLLKFGISPFLQNHEGNNFLHFATLKSQHSVLERFHSRTDINAKNGNGETCLHIAISLGHKETITTLLNVKAKTNVKNFKGETALHVAAVSPFTSPEIAKALVSYTIQNHDWESLNAIDKYGNNALHQAAKFAKPDVLWEFRFLRFKDTDEDGNTPLHESVRENDPEVLETMLDIFESMQRDGDIDQGNKKMQTVLHLTAVAGFCNTVIRLLYLKASLDAQDENGNTVLHNLVLAIVNDPIHTKRYMDVFDTIVKECVRWFYYSSKFKKEQVTEKQDLSKRYKRQALVYLMQDIQNDDNLSVLGLASKLGAHEILASYLTLDDVTVFREPDTMDIVWLDVTNVTPETSDNLSRKYYQRRESSNKIGPMHKKSALETLISAKDRARATRTLDIPSMREIEKMYNVLNAFVYVVLIIAHIAYMSVFTYVGTEISKAFREQQINMTSTDPVYLLAYIIIPFEPFVLLVYTLMSMYTVVKRRHCSEPLYFLLPYLFYFTYAILIIVWIVLISVEERYQDYILATCLCFGWLFTITFTRGFKAIHYFWRMLLNMVARDISRFIVVYLFVLMAFTFSLHCLFQISQDISKTYASPGDSMFLVFNLMIGMAELFDDNFESGMESVGRTSVVAKIFYIFYIVLATIVLLNMLIAMMNDSYSDILQNQTITWRIDSVELGVSIERLLPFTRKLFNRVIHRHIPGEYPDFEVMKYFLSMTESQFRNYMSQYRKHELSKEQASEAIQDRIGRLETRLESTESQLSSINNNLSDIVIALKGIKGNDAK